MGGRIFSHDTESFRKGFLDLLILGRIERKDQGIDIACVVSVPIGYLPDDFLCLLLTGGNRFLGGWPLVWKSDAISEYLK